MREAVQQADLDFVLQEVPEAIEQSIEGLERIRTIVGAMKSYSHPDSQAPTNFELLPMLESTALVSRGEWREAAEVIIDADGAPSSISGFRSELSQALLNLVVNAAHAIGSMSPATRGRIEVRAKSADGAAEIIVDDSGPGVPEAIRSRIFEPFFTTKEVGQGTGQGLELVHKIIVGRHGGSIRVEDSHLGGARFVLRIPQEAAT